MEKWKRIKTFIFALMMGAVCSLFWYWGGEIVVVGFMAFLIYVIWSVVLDNN